MSSYQLYGKSVAFERSIPDIRDGLKPVQRRIIYSMGVNGNLSNKPSVKSARIVGDVMGKFHPHGDSSIYEAMAKMSQDFYMNHPLIIGQGNFGSIDGDAIASSRYTEAKLSPLADNFLRSIKKDTVDFIDNFDGSLKEPEVIPTMFPNLLMNGTSGIAVGIATEIPSFNLIELIDAAIWLINSPNCRDKTLLNFIKGPDFPCGGMIVSDNMEDILLKGSGKIEIYGTMKVEKGKIYITEIPQTYAGNKTALIKDLAQKAESKIFEIKDIEDQSAKDIRIEIKLNRGSDPDQVISKIYKYTGMKSSYDLNFTAIKKDKILTFNIRDYLEEYVSFIKEIKKRELIFDKRKLEKEIKRVNALIFASENISTIVDAIKNSPNVATVKKCFMTGDTKGIKFSLKKYESAAKSFRLTEEEADTILSIRLSSLVSMELLKLRKEKEKLEKDLREINKLLKDEEAFKQDLVKDLQEIKKNYGQKRKTVIKENIKLSKIKEKKKKAKQIYVLVDRLNYVKAIDESSYGRVESFDGLEVIPMMSDDRLAVFFDDGYIRYLDGDEIPLVSFNDRGVALESKTESVGAKAMLFISQSKLEESSVLFVSQGGFGKITSGEDYRPTGKARYRKILGSKLNDGDRNILVALYDENGLIEVESQERVLKFKMSDIPSAGKQARGSYLMNKRYLPLIDARTDNFLSERVRKRGMTGEKK